MKTWNLSQCARPVEAPESWSATAVEIAATHYFRKHGNDPHAKDCEWSVAQLFRRVVSAIRVTGEAQGYFSAAESKTFARELEQILLEQKASFNSPVYFNVGIYESYGIAGSGESFAWDFNRQEVMATTTTYTRPQASACFIQDVQDDLLSIFDLLKSEAKLFKYGSGTGTNFSRLRARGEPLDGGGESTGLISYLEIYDKAAQAIKSGGTTRRAAKMVVLDADHPEILEFVRWKRDEERKARVLMANGFSGGMDGEAFRTVSGQNSNNSVRVNDAFLNKILNNESWIVHSPRTQKPMRTLKAGDLFREVAKAAWECADPGLQFQDTIQKWNMCPKAGEIRASNPCSEFMFLDNSACNLASLNLVKFWDGERFDWPEFKRVIRLMLLAQEILVDYASYPTLAIAENSHHFRPLGLGFANLGGLLMRMGFPYDSEEGRQWCVRITGALHALALERSAEIAEAHGAFAGWKENRDAGLHVLDLHRAAWFSRRPEDMKWLDETWTTVLHKAERLGLRHAQVTLLAPTGTIGLLMDCDTLGIEPEFALRKTKHRAGGGEFHFLNNSVGPALEKLGYSSSQTREILLHLEKTGSVASATALQSRHQSIFDCALPPSGFPERRISPEAHLQMMAAAQPFLSGAISKTVNMPITATVEDVEAIFLRAWQLGLKSVAIYRDGSKSVQPLCADC